MSNRSFNAVSLDDQSGICIDSSTSSVIGLCIKSALVANLTMTGVNQASGLPAAWVVTAGPSGFVAPPAAALCNRLAFSFANPADPGKAVLIYQPL